METIEKISAERCTKMEFSNLMNLSGIFTHSVDDKALYFSRFGVMPNNIHIDEVDFEKANEWLLKTYHADITDCYYNKCLRKKDKIDFSGSSYFLFEDLMIDISSCYEINLNFRKTDNALVEKIAHGLHKFKLSERKIPTIRLLVNGRDGLETRRMEIKKPKLTIKDNYNDDFLPIHKTILSRLQKKNDKGLVLLHGKPGTGKTSYVRYLISSLKKNVIFLPPNMASSITDPGLMNVMIENPNSVFVIEDAENIIIDRNRAGSSSVSALLNLADGLLSDCLNIQIICSFNTDLSRVDSALMRKGRLIAKYEFNELETQKAQALSDKLGFSTQITEPMTLASVYNQNDAEFAPTIHRKAIGFY